MNCAEVRPRSKASMSGISLARHDLCGKISLYEKVTGARSAFEGSAACDFKAKLIDRASLD
eukprot:3326759-Amphidinium_carterae.1